MKKYTNYEEGSEPTEAIDSMEMTVGKNLSDQDCLSYIVLENLKQREVNVLLPIFLSQGLEVLTKRT